MRRSTRLSAALVSPFQPTHQVTNQAPPIWGYNAYLSNRRMCEMVALKAEDKIPADKLLTDHGARVGSKEYYEHAVLANENIPVFNPFDQHGNRVNGVKFHPSYHAIMAAGIDNHVPSFAWTQTKDKPLHKCRMLVRCSLSYMQYQMESGTSCPMTMTFAAVPALAAFAPKDNSQDFDYSRFIQKLTSGKYDSRDVHFSLKTGATCGMSMTEKQGGSDVRANTTVAERDASGKFYRLRGHKWFTSAPMCDAFLTLAKIDGQKLSCFVVPRWISAGERNEGLRFQRLKNKAGDRSNASSEVEYDGAVGYLLGEPGHGVRTIIEMVNYTRLDCLLGSAALMQQSALHAVHHAFNRAAFGSLLISKPLMLNVLTDLIVESEAATALALTIASAFDDDSSSINRALQRLGTAVAKYHVCKTAPQFVYECLECLGGNGFVEESPLARYFRQAPLNAVWEGSGNVIVLDMFRALQREPETMSALIDFIGSTGDMRLVNSAVEFLGEMKQDPSLLEFSGRVYAERLATLLQAAALRAAGPSEIYEMFVQSRVVASSRSRHFGTLNYTMNGKKFVERAIERYTPRS